MKKLMIGWIALCGALAGFAEKPYDFRKELECVHTPGVVDWGLKPAADEFAFAEDAVISIPADAGEVLALAAKDFVDYLDVSMGVSTRVGKEGKRGGVALSLDASLREREYEVKVGEGVSIRAKDERTAAQALYHLEDLMNLRRAPFLTKGAETRRMVFSPRMSHSGYGIDDFPEPYLAKMAHFGLDSILVFVKDVHLTSRAGKQYQDLNALIRRAKKYGLDTYLYSYVVAWVHPDDPNAKEVFDSTYGRIAAAFPEARGIVFVGESCKFPSKDERTNTEPFDVKIAKGDMRPHPGWFPCRDYPDWVRGVKAAIDAKAPGMEIVFWTYNWGKQPKEDRLKLIDGLPKDVTLMATYEMYEHFKLSNGFETKVGDYSIAFEGPGQYFVSEAEEAHRQGLRLYTQAMAAGLTWDYGSVPYQPCPFQWKRRWDALRESNRKWNLTGIMESHHNGWWPSFVAELEKEAYVEGGIPFDEHIRRIAARDYGEANAEAVVAVWKKWSDAAREYSPVDGNQYGPFRIGPAYPYNFGGRHIDRSEFPNPPHASNGIGICFLNFTEPIWYEKMYYPEKLAGEIEVLTPVVKTYMDGAAVFREAAKGLSGCQRKKALRMANFGEYLGRTVATGLNLKRGAQAWEKRDMDAVKAIAREEYANAEATLPLVDADSRLGWEPSMEYCGSRAAIEWKLRKMKDLYWPDASAAANVAEMKLMSFNVCHCEGMDKKIDIVRTAAAIKAENPDFACLQEIDWRTARVNGVDEPAELARLTGMHATFAKAIFYAGGQYGVMMLSRQKPLSVKKVPLPGKEPRMLLLCEFEDCWVGTMHLSVAGEKERMDSIAIIKRAVAEAGRTKPVFLTGDWNSMPDSKVLKGIGEFMSVLSDTVCQTFHGRPINGPDGQPLDMSRFCIDYVAVDSVHAPGFRVTDTHVVEDRVTSDHAPIVATVAVPVPELPAPAVVPQPASLKPVKGVRFEKATDVTADLVRFIEDLSVAKEGYDLRITPEGITVSASTETGRFYALETLKQLALPRLGKLAFPCLEIRDAPRFGWRGVHIDDSRHFFGKAAVKRTLDLMAFHKMNVLHWHLTDDEGWRFPVAKRPELARDGSSRPHSANQKDLADRFEGGTYGPFAYSEADIREVVAYAAARHIRVIPEIDVPGHSQTALKVHPELLCFPKGSSEAPQGAVANVFCLGNDESLKLIDDVFEAVCDLFPDEIVHIGGDEVNKVNWEACPKCRARMKELGLKDGKALQSWQMNRTAALLAKRGKRVIGWDEMILDGQAPEKSVVMSWRGAEGGIAAAKMGLESVMTPHYACYFDYDQCIKDDPAVYPWFTHPLPLKDVYAYEPLAGIPADQQKYVLGGQCCNWAEYTCDETELQWKMWPRACATAEVFWTPAARRDFADFRRRMETHRSRLTALHVNCAPLE